MDYEFFRAAVKRSFYEMELLANQLNDELVQSHPLEGGRPLGDVFLHILRSAVAYTRGLATDEWGLVDFSLKKYSTAKAIQNLFLDVLKRVDDYLNQVTPEMMLDTVDVLNRPATKGAILAEMIEHTAHHRGQITAYYRLLGVTPAEIPYIV
ncbi:MAG: DinB family protein [Candidatus Ranarchaeia archaeon]